MPVLWWDLLPVVGAGGSGVGGTGQWAGGGSGAADGG